MAINFEYTLGVNESSSLRSLSDFITKVEGTEAKLKLNFDTSTLQSAIESVRTQINNLDSAIGMTISNFDFDTSSMQQQLNKKANDLKVVLNVEFDGLALAERQKSPGGKIRQEFEQELKLMQDSTYRMLNNLKAQMDKANIGADIINTDAIMNSIGSLDLANLSFAEIKSKIKDIKNDIQGWQQAIKLNNNLLVNTGQVTDQIRQRMEQANQAMSADETAKLAKALQTYERKLAIQQRSVTSSRQFKEATDDVRNAIENELTAMQVSGSTLQELSDSYQEASLRIREMNSELRAQHIEENGYAFNNLSTSVSNLVTQYISLEKALQMIEAAFRATTEYVLELDDAYTDVAISMNISRGEFSEWTKDARKIAQANGQTTTSLMEMVKIYATAGESIETIQDKLAGTAMFQNITQWNAEQSTAAIGSVISQYRLMEKEINGVTGDVANAIQYVGDNLIAISNELTIDNVAGIQEMVSAIDDAGSVVSNAGGSMEWYMGVTSTLAETMNATGSEVGAAMRMITARTLQQKQAFSALDDSGEDVEIAMANAEKALRQIGVTIRNGTSGELRDLEDILEDVADKWKYLDDSTKQLVGEKLAGNNRRSYFETLMDNYDRVIELQEAGEQSFGAMSEANEYRVESLQGQYAILTDKIMEFTSAMEPMLFVFADWGIAVMDFANAFGTIPSTIAMGTTAFLAFSERGKELQSVLTNIAGSYNPVINSMNNYIATGKQEIKTLTDNIMRHKQVVAERLAEINAVRAQGGATATLIAQLKVEQIALTQTQLALVKATVATYAMQAALTLGLSAAISGVVWAIGKIVDGLKTLATDRSAEVLAEKIQKLNEATVEYGKAASDLAEVKQDIASAKVLATQLEAENLTMEEQQELTEKINGLFSKHASNYTSIESILKNESIALETKIALLEREAELQREISLNSLEEQANQKDYWGFGKTSFERAIEQSKTAVDDLQFAKQLLDSEIAHYESMMFEDSVEHIENVSQGFDKKTKEITQGMQSTLTSMATTMSTYLTLFNEGRLDEVTFNAYKQQYIDAIEEVRAVLSDLGITDVPVLSIFDEATVDNVKSRADEIVDAVQTTITKISDLSTATDSTSDMRKLQDSLQETVGNLLELDEGSEQAQKVLLSLKSTFTDMPADINTLAEAIEYLNGKMEKNGEALTKLSYVEALEGVEEAQELINSFKDGLDAGEMRSIFDSELMNDYNGSLSDTASILEHLKNKLQELKDESYETGIAMTLNNEDAWNQMTTDMAESLGVQTDEFQQYLNNKNLMRNVDIQNAESAADAQKQAEMSVVRDGAIAYSDLMNSKAGNRQTDMGNVAAFLNTQKAKEAQTVDELKQMWAEYYNARKKLISDEISKASKAIDKMAGPYDDQANIDPEVMSQFNSLRQQLLALEQANDNMTDYFANVGTNLTQVSNTLGQTAANVSNSIGSTINGASGSGSNKNPSSSSSSSKKDVADLELEIDRYYKLNDAIRDLDNSLADLQSKREQITTKAAYKKSMEDEIALVNKQVTAYQNLLKEQQKERDEVKSTLKKNGFAFDSSNNITNYATQLQKLQDAANKKSGEAKEAAIAQVKALADLIERYNELNDSAIPETSVEIQNLKNEVANLTKELEENMKAIDKMGDRYFTITSKIAQIDNALSMNLALQETADDERKIELMKEQIELIKQRQALVKEEREEAKKEASELKDQLSKQGVKFDKNGQITNYQELIDKLEKDANNLVGSAQDEAVANIEKLLELIEAYTTLTNSTIPDLDLAWQEYANEMESVNDAIEDIYRQQKEAAVQVQKDIASAYEKYLTERYNKLKDALNKEKEAYNKAYEEENFQRNLDSQQRALDEIAQQIAIYSRDTSEAGKARLEQLKKEYEAQQQAINDAIRENEKSLADERFDEEQEKLDDELADMLAPEKLIAAVNDAIASGMITVGDEVIKLDDLMSDWIDSTGDGLYLLGDTIKEEFIGNLQNAKDLMEDMGLINIGDSIQRLQQLKTGESKSQSTINFNQPLVQVESMASDVDTTKLAEQLKSEVFKAINDAMK